MVNQNIMQVTKINNTISVQLKNSFDQPEIINSIKFFDRFNVDLKNQIKEAEKIIKKAVNE
jgi:hypothetical protein